MYNWEDNVRKVEPYVPGEQPKEKNIIKLNTNENPYGPSKNVQKVLDNMDGDMFRKYPDEKASELVNEIAEFHNISSDHVFVGVGSDDVLGMAFMTFFNSDKKILFPDISYSFYPVWAEMLKIPYETCPLDDNFRINIEDYFKENGGVVIANPNAPTGILLEKDDVVKIIENNKDSIVIIDEAYIDFAKEGSSVIDLVDDYDNLLVVRTFSKSRSLAGLRVGYAVANPLIIKYINDVKYSYNSYTMNYASIALGKAVLKDNDYFLDTISKIKNTREWFSSELEKRDFDVLPSSTNFVFATHKSVSAKEIFENAKKNKIFVRYFNLPKIDNYLRITIGTDEEMKAVISFLDEFLTK